MAKKPTPAPVAAPKVKKVTPPMPRKAPAGMTVTAWKKAGRPKA